ncbi:MULTISPECIES: PsbP-related protein [unclassified Saccharicrinis]|uniref:PsbP-related protein n=1 Tax=unclassified Saccharicrinis TaxID=2646859 RepID=UPI003D32F6A7
MRQILKLYLFAFLILILNINTHGQKEPGIKTLEKDKYSVNYPFDWDLDESGLHGASFILFSPILSGEDMFRENINLLIQDLSAYNIDLDKYVEISEGQIKTMVKNGKLISSERLNDGQNYFQKVIYTGDQDIYKLKFEQYYWVKNKKAYVLTLTCENHMFDSYKETGEEILKSFKLN